jgi:hypothetical protein
MGDQRQWAANPGRWDHLDSAASGNRCVWRRARCVPVGPAFALTSKSDGEIFDIVGRKGHLSWKILTVSGILMPEGIVPIATRILCRNTNSLSRSVTGT